MIPYFGREAYNLKCLIAKCSGVGVFEPSRDYMDSLGHYITKIHALYTLPAIVKAVKSKRLLWVEHADRMVNTRNA
jgi:hypothetical protein